MVSPRCYGNYAVLPKVKRKPGGDLSASPAADEGARLPRVVASVLHVHLRALRGTLVRGAARCVPHVGGDRAAKTREMRDPP